MKRNLATTALLSLALSACGVETNKDQDKNEENTTGATPTTGSTADEISGTEIITDQELSGPIITASIEESLSAMADEPESDASGLLRLTDTATSSNSLERYRNCEEVDASAHVTIQHALSRESRFEGPFRIFDTKIDINSDTLRKWSKEGAEINCAASMKHAAVPVADMEGVSLGVDFKRHRERSGSVTNKATQVKKDYLISFDAEGTRLISWDSVVEGEEGFVIDKTITSDVSRTLLLNNGNGKEKNFSGTVVVGDAAPLKIETLRDAATLEPLQRTIKSGLVTAASNIGSITTEFSMVVYNAGSCMPESGSISGVIKAGDEELSYNISFNGSNQASIAFSNGDTYDYTPQGCDLEEAEEVIEKEEPIASADDDDSADEEAATATSEED